MPRIKLEPLSLYPFAMDIKVRITDLNYGGHLGNDSLLSLIHEARMAFLASHGFSEEKFAGASLIMSDVAIVFRKEAYAGDVLRFEAGAAEPSRGGFRLFFRVTLTTTHELVALVENGMVCFNYLTHSSQRLPEEAHVIFQNQ